ncbi:MAG: polysaccharide deacetylase family protein [Acidobacteriota bacterium]
MTRALLSRLLSKGGLLPVLRAVAPWSGVLALNYHRIGDGHASRFDRGLWSADAEGFDAHLRFLAAHFTIVTPRDLPAIRRAGRGRFVLVTFDDGYRDNYEAAFPILRRHGIAATFFIATGFLDCPRLPWWDEMAWMVRTSRRNGIEPGRWLPGPVAFDEPDREMAVRSLLRAYKSMPATSTDAFLEFLGEATGSGRCESGQAAGTWMSWDMVREMHAAGMVIGGHTVTHPVLARLTRERQWEEISTCARRLTEELGEPMRYFSYPVGSRSSFDDDTRACLRRAEVRQAFSYYGGTTTFERWDDFNLCRIGVERDMDGDWVRATVTLPGVFGRPN